MSTRLIALIAFLTVPGNAFQLGPESLPAVYSGAQLLPDKSCETALIRQIWGFSNKGAWKPYDPSALAYPDQSIALQPVIVVDCPKPPDTAHLPDLPVLLHGALWKAVGDGTFSKIRSEWQAYNPVHDKLEPGDEQPRHILLQHGFRQSGPDHLPMPSRLESKPPFYGAKRVRFLGANCFIGPMGRPLDGDAVKDFAAQYKVVTVAATPDNVNDINTVISALLGKVTAATPASPPAPPPPPVNEFTLNAPIAPQRQITIEPAAFQIRRGRSQQLSAKSGREPLKHIEWRLGPGSAGTISPKGIYTAPPNAKPGDEATIIAVDRDHPQDQGRAVAGIFIPLSVYPPEIDLLPGGSTDLIATVDDKPTDHVTLTLAPSGFGVIDGHLKYTAPRDAPVGTAAKITVSSPDATNDVELTVNIVKPLACRLTSAVIESQSVPFDVKITLTGGGGKETPPPGPGGGHDDEPDAYGGPNDSTSYTLAADDPPAKPDSTAQSDSGCTSASSSAACSQDHSFHVPAAEWWDVGLGISAPGVREPNYSPSDPSVLKQPTRHSEIYGLVNLFPFARWAAKDSLAPSIAVGIPVTGKVFYRPFFGIGESLSGISALKKTLPMQINILGGFVYLNQEVVNSNAAGALQIDHARVWKPTLVVEVPVGALISKIGLVGSKSSSTGGGGGKGQ
jgi:hypothetical protein